MRHISYIILIFVLLSCSSSNLITENNTNSEVNDTVETGDEGNNGENNSSENEFDLKILALGDSYTIGESVCVSCRFPVQLKDSLVNHLNTDISVDIIAQTGWTTTKLFEAIVDENPPLDFDLVTLLIGVNNQFQGKPFELYEQEFPLLVSQAIALGQNDKNNVIVVSIPDYAYTPYGQNNANPELTSSEIDAYNTFAENYCIENDITYVYITDITRQGLIETDLVASDNLHPSELAYTRFVERLLPIAIEKIE